MLNKSFLSASLPVCVSCEDRKEWQLTLCRRAGLFTVRTGVLLHPPGVACVARHSFCQPVLHLPPFPNACLLHSPRSLPQICRALGPPHDRPPPRVVIYFSLTQSQEEREHCDTGLLMFMLSTCQSRGELSGSGSVNWALIRCCSN